jgi:hypothetical protein
VFANFDLNSSLEDSTAAIAALYNQKQYAQMLLEIGEGDLFSEHREYFGKVAPHRNFDYQKDAIDFVFPNGFDSNTMHKSSILAATNEDGDVWNRGFGRGSSIGRRLGSLISPSAFGSAQAEMFRTHSKVRKSFNFRPTRVYGDFFRVKTDFFGQKWGFFQAEVRPKSSRRPRDRPSAFGLSRADTGQAGSAGSSRNTAIQVLNPNPVREFLSADVFDEADDPYGFIAEMMTTEALNSFTRNGCPPHKLKLKVGECIILRNLAKTDGLSNNTRVRIMFLGKFSIRVETLEGLM